MTSKPTPRTRTRPQQLAVPNTKISETIIDFGEPLFSQFVQPPPTAELLRAPFEIVIGVWNAHVMAMPSWGKPELLEWLEDIVYSRTAPSPLMAMFEQLTLRRLEERFAHDPRAVAVWDIVLNSAGERRFQCDGRIPPGYVRQPKKTTASLIYLKLQS